MPKKKTRPKTKPKQVKKAKTTEIEVIKRRQAISERIIAGDKDRNQICEDFKISQATYYKDLDAIHKEWRELTKERAEELLLLRTNQLEEIFKQAMLDHVKSMEEELEIRITKAPEKCPLCRGRGWVQEEDYTCERCDGEGFIYIQTTQRKLSFPKAGDASYLNEARKALEQLIKIEGHNAPVEMTTTERKIHTHLIAGQDIPNELLLDAMEAYARVERAKKKAITVQSVPVG